MFEVGKILYFSPFIFKNGSQPKPKYFIVLAHDHAGVVLASLPTSKDHVPMHLDHLSGCINDDAISFNAFVFNAGQVVTDSGFAFPRKTYIYGEQLDRYVPAVFEQQLAAGDTIIEVKGMLLQELFDTLKNCLKASSRVKRSFKRLL